MNENTDNNFASEQGTGKPAMEKLGPMARLRRFLKSNSDMIVKLYVHQFGLTVFGYLLYSAASASGNKPLVLGLGIFSAIFYLILLYVLSWDVGARDKIRIDGGRLERDIFKGAKVTLVGMAPNLVIALISLTGYVLRGVGAWANGLYGIAQIVGVFLNSMYLGIDEYTTFSTSPLYLFVICLPAIAVCGFGYALGTYEKLGVLTSVGNKSKKR